MADEKKTADEEVISKAPENTEEAREQSRAMLKRSEENTPYPGQDGADAIKQGKPVDENGEPDAAAEKARTTADRADAAKRTEAAKSVEASKPSGGYTTR